MRILRNDGISIVALVMVLLLLSTLGTVLVSLIITKQKSALLPLKSTQAFYAAQAGIEYAIRHTQDNYDDMDDFQANYTTPLVQEELSGIGYFEVTYNDSENFIRSTGTGTAGTAKRVIKLASFRDFLTLTLVGGITLDPDPENAPYQDTAPGEKKNICVPTVNNYDCDVYIFQIDLAKDKEGGKKAARLDQIRLGNTPVWTGKKVDVSTTPDSPTPFPFNQVAYYTMVSGAALDKIEVQAASEVSGTWHLTFHYSKQTDLSDPETNTITFDIP